MRRSPDVLESRVRAQPRQRVALPQAKEQRTDLGRDLGFDDRKHRRPSAARPLAPHREDDAPAGPQHAAHLAQCLRGIGHVHEAERAQRDIEAAIGQVEAFGIHARERRVRHAAFLRAPPRGVDHPSRQVHADDAAVRADRLAPRRT